MLKVEQLQAFHKFKATPHPISHEQVTVEPNESLQEAIVEANNLDKQKMNYVPDHVERMVDKATQTD